MFTYRRPLFVHAHPDDETIVTGAWLAALVAEGAWPAVLTATRGEQGEVAGLAAGSAEHRAWRVGEWGRALDVLGVERRAWLGSCPARAEGLAERVYEDSGMRWLDHAETVAGPGDSAGPLALTAADEVEVARDIAACARTMGADSVVTYDAFGGYGHPDHVALNRPAMSAASQCGLPGFEIVSRGRQAGGTTTQGLVIGIDASAHRQTLVAALACYASQVRVDGDAIVHVGGQREPLTLALQVKLAR